MKAPLKFATLSGLACFAVVATLLVTPVISSAAFKQASAATGVSNAIIVTLSPGLTRSQVVAAFADYSTRISDGVQSIQVFSKSGGSLAGGEFNQNNRVDIPVNVTNNHFAFQYYVPDSDVLTPGDSHCSDVRVHTYIDGHQVYVSDWLGYATRSPALPIQTNETTISGVSNGQHVFAITPEGRIGGCNIQGYILSWGGAVSIFS
ncbi:MAG: hypothetical protein ABI361_03380 [Nitrososphaera sp.]|jgi:hypothetical protein